MTKTEQLEQLEKMCELILAEKPKRKCMYTHEFESNVYQNRLACTPGNIDKTLRNGVIFYSNGWGWRLRKNWQETLQAKREAL